LTKGNSTGHIDTLLGPDTVVTGDVRTAGGLRLDGQLEGKVEAGEAFLSGPRSFLRGNLQCGSAVIAGRVEGNVTCRETVELQAGAHVKGDVSCAGMVIQRGSYFEGNCTMRREADPALGGSQ
jgi:cytoskeletal protein CcmA (bactofilin family)